jgi:hypothetical protein
MSSLRTLERVVGVVGVAVWLGFMAHYYLKSNPGVSSRATFYARRAARMAQWRVMYPHLPTWAQEAAQVRGLAPFDAADTSDVIDLSAFKP